MLVSLFVLIPGDIKIMETTPVLEQSPGLIRRKVAYVALAVSMLYPLSSAHAVDTLFDFSLGARTDDFNWSIAGTENGTNPNILSELTWNNIKSTQANFGFDLISESGITLQTRVSYASIDDGRVTDSDFLGDNGTFEFSRSAAESDNDDMIDISLSLGKEIVVTNTQATTVTPLAGVSYHSEDFRITDGVQVIDRFGGTAGQPLVGLDSSYNAEWWSAFLGFQIDHRRQRWETYGRMEYHNVEYEAEGNWNLRDDLAHPVSFRHDADGSGPLYQIGARYFFNPRWAFHASFTKWKWDAKNGTDRTYFSDGSSASTRLNTAQWKSEALMLGISFVSKRN